MYQTPKPEIFSLVFHDLMILAIKLLTKTLEWYLEVSQTTLYSTDHRYMLIY